MIHRLPTRDAAYLVITDVLEFIHPLTVIEQHVTCHLFNRHVFYLGDTHFHEGERILDAGISFPLVFLPTYIIQQFALYSKNLNTKLYNFILENRNLNGPLGTNLVPYFPI